MLTGLFALIISATPQADVAIQGYDLPARFVADRVFVEPTTVSGKTLNFYTDSGGGANLLCRDAATRFGLATKPVSDPQAEQELGKHLAIAQFPAFESGHGIPVDADGDDHLLVYDCTANAMGGDGFLSSRWFAGRIWTWDYPHGHLRLEGAAWVPPKSATRVRLGFKTGADGKRKSNFARITVHIDGKPLDMLIDTGATAMLTPVALKAMADKQPALRATSFIVASRFKSWRTAHPNWRVIEKAQSLLDAAMIEVPEVEIAGARVGPVWFTWRPDENFHKFMSSMMDSQVEGALGGNALDHFVITVDYPKAAAYFQCTSACSPTPLPAP